MSVSILVVDDETDVAALFRQHFRHEVRQGQYVLHFANSAAEALRKLESGIEPQLIVILSDINMPEMDGLSLLRKIKPRWPELPVIMVTAYGDEDRRRRANEYGAADFITKPVDFGFLKKELQHPNLKRVRLMAQPRSLQSMTRPTSNCCCASASGGRSGRVSPCAVGLR